MQTVDLIFASPLSTPDAIRQPAFAEVDDPATLATLIELHAPRRRPLDILDVTASTRKMWRGLDYPVATLDRNASLDVDYVGDFRDLRHVRDRASRRGKIATASVDVLVFDPPYRSESGRRSIYAERFGLIQPELQRAANIVPYFRPFLAEARRVLRPDGVLLAKIGDQVHRGARQFQPFEFWLAVRETEGLRSCDVRFQGRPPDEFPYEGEVMHLLTNGVCWFVVRASRSCMRRRPWRRPKS